MEYSTKSSTLPTYPLPTPYLLPPYPLPTPYLLPLLPKFLLPNHFWGLFFQSELGFPVSMHFDTNEPPGKGEGQITCSTRLTFFTGGSSGRATIALTNLSVHTPPEKTRRGGRPTREAMTLTGLHQKFLLHCEVERQLARQTIVS